MGSRPSRCLRRDRISTIGIPRPSRISSSGSPEAGLTLHAVHAPVMTAYQGSRWVAPLSLASSDAGARAHAVAEAEHAIHIARRIPVTVVVMHVGVPRTENGAAGDGRAAATPEHRGASRGSPSRLAFSSRSR